MLKRPGAAFIINSGHNRPGHRYDTDKLISLFDRLQIKVHLCPSSSGEDGPTAADVEEFLLQQLNDYQTCASRFGSVWVILMGHGSKENICLLQGNLSIQQVLRRFNNAFRNNLKVGLIHCCRKTNGVEDSSPMPGRADLPPETAAGVGSNWLLCRSTLQGTYAYRDPSRGTRFVQEVLDVFNFTERERQIYQSPLLDLFNAVIRNLSRVDDRRGPAQQAVLTHSLTNPGIRILDLAEEKQFAACIDLGTNGTAICAASHLNAVEHHDRFGYHGRKESSDILVRKNLDLPTRFEEQYGERYSPYKIIRHEQDIYAVIFGIYAETYARRQPLAGVAVQTFYFRNFKQQLNGRQEQHANEKLHIRDVNNQEFDAEILMTLIFTYFKEGPLVEKRHHFMKSNHGHHNQTLFDMRLAVTIPAHWGLRAKQLIRRGARNAGLYQNEGDMLLVLEPEAAAYHCISSGSGRGLLVGESFFVADVGGGTIDYATLQVFDRDPLVLKVIAAPQGTTFGANIVTQRFIELLKLAFNPDVVQNNASEITLRWERLRQSGEVLHVHYDVDVRLEVPTALLEAGEPRIPGFRWTPHGELCISREVTRSCFEPVTHNVCSTLASMKRAFPDVETAFLVGAFANQVPCRGAVEDLGLTVKVPQNPELAVSFGGVELAKEPSRIASRVSMFSYGISKGVTTHLERYPDAPRKRLKDGRDAVLNVFDCFSAKDAEIPEGSTASRTYVPLEHDQDSITFSIFATASPSQVFVTEPGMEKIGSIKIDVAGCSNKSVILTFHFQASFISVQARSEAGGQELSTEVEFFGSGEFQVDPDAQTFVQP